MDWGSFPDWLGGVGGVASAGTAAAFYWMDRRRNASEKRAALLQEVTDRSHIIEEFQKTVSMSLQALAAINEKAEITESAWAYYNGILANYRSRLRELMMITVREARLSIAIGQAAQSLAFSNLPLEHLELWLENVALAEGGLQRSLDIGATL